MIALVPVRCFSITFNRRKGSGASKQFYFTSYFLGSKMLKSPILRELSLAIF